MACTQVVYGNFPMCASTSSVMGFSMPKYPKDMMWQRPYQRAGQAFKSQLHVAQIIMRTFLWDPLLFFTLSSVASCPTGNARIKPH